jgi:acetylornithine deacetylase
MMDVVDLTRRLVEIESPSFSEGRVVEFMHGLLLKAGYQVIRQPVSDGRDNLYAFREPPVVVLSTHLDCVPPFVPWREDGDMLHGRGVCDAKGLAAAMFVAAERLSAAGEQRVGLLFVVGEERGSDGARAAASLEPKGKFLINGEPTEGLLCVAQKGSLLARVEVRGVPAHSAYPEEGTSAILKLLTVLDRLRRMPLPFDPVLGPATLNIGVIAGGNAPNVIPEHATAEVLVRTVGPSDRLREQFLGVAEAGVTITFPAELPHYLGERLDGWETTAVRFASDLPLHSTWGRRFQLGPGPIRVAHTLDERITRGELEAGTEAYVRICRQLLVPPLDTSSTGG